MFLAEMTWQQVDEMDRSTLVVATFGERSSMATSAARNRRPYWR